ncbi:bifunctional N-acetylglucosamine-1-phosphate uridyltransferase/glucosamine-1-phosphate acetyltransferase [Labrenzia sp. CP4]|jgi:bifunctional UDP-N-acetylglucosamine pyrophosphorylase/glucosamine-1-phosphate N-acetyltransferase|uniref:bifunctional UDP-N-acetylglucosamine diphosphorylase/glucosamine-1-phosphate N-acetyltransferase GlmU n=1 Tax=Labrenzia sp. CP4 TaxID=1674922 RepID=UPI0007813970|nr:bifunctional UDP-N-acetylglucosamine diphosphorylase/glucosamine-1-phosphate N-acetyltransferase GlmU [Labrenzia sp. CP4]AMN53406.1 bifunctional N-acetylglucosamine-1-phosphate uridyltransferase/glucosamine-1-phosphate acetyltransferase [Labrenzia sp. CP4]
MTSRSCLSIVLAAGLGTRMKSNLPKVMHEIGGLPLVGHVVKALKQAGSDRISVVTGPDMRELEKLVQNLAPEAHCHVQHERLGTAHAALAARSALASPSDDVLILFGDTPLVTADTIGKVRRALSDGADLAVLGFETQQPFGYGRLLTDNGQLVAIREEKDASDAERRITFCNSGIMGFSGQHALSLLDAIGNANAKNEFYLTDAVEIANSRGLKVVAVSGSEVETQGINTRAQLAACEEDFQVRMRNFALENGCTLLAPHTVYFSHDTVLESDVVVEQNVVFAPGVRVASGARIRAFSHLEGASVGRNSAVGPYARLRPGTVLGADTRIGNFVEVKNTTFEDGAKANHLSYIGDASVGSKSNIGAGTITCNYDGYLKHRTEIGAGSFVGSNSTLVAPVSLGSGSFVAAGSVITDDVDQDSMAFGRARQIVKEGKAKQLRERLKAAKETKS